MVSVRVLRPPAPADIDVIRALEDAARARDGHESLAAAIWRDLDAPTAASTGLLATDDGRPVGYLHLVPSDTLDDDTLIAGLVLHPDHRHDGVAVALLEAIGPAVAAHDGGRIRLWVNDAGDDLDSIVTGAGFHRFIEQFQMRVPLPLSESPRWPEGISVRPFVPGQDDAAWLAVNNRAFNGHPDQGNWSRSTLAPRLAEPWFDADGFRLAFARDALAGFCWTKVHEADPETGDGRMGEIYAVGVDPAFQGMGLGRALTVDGLNYLYTIRDCPTGLLYVDNKNPAALSLYRALGFTVYRADRAYEREVSRV
jgi:mycothiol synthase